MEAKRMFLKNDNNRLNCEAFLQIHFAPPGPIKESDLSQIYVVDIDGKDEYMRMEGFIRYPFDQIGSVFTLPAAGKTMEEWKKEWLQTYPNTTPNTMMAVYMYRKAVSDL